MIKIDLGKGPESKSKQGDALRKIALQLKMQQPYEQLLARFDNDASRMIAFLVSILLSVLPYLFVGEYQRVVTNKYERKMQSIEKEINAIDGEIAALTPFKQELESYEAQQKQVAQRLQVIRELLETRGTPVSTLDAVAQALPEGIWLDTIVFDSADRNAEKVALTGKALNNEDISDYMDRLSQSSHLRNVKLVSVDPASAEGKSSRIFAIDLDVNSQTAAASNQQRDLGSK